jgi:hypothetical protein
MRFDWSSGKPRQLLLPVPYLVHTHNCPESEVVRYGTCQPVMKKVSRTVDTHYIVATFLRLYDKEQAVFS